MFRPLILMLLLTNNLLSQNLPVKLDRTNQIKKYNGFTISYNELHEQANWIKYTLNKENLFCVDGAERKDNFKDDFFIETTSSYEKDYVRSGYDRGHLKPAADEPCSQDRMDETFKMVNISPQVPGFNRGIWRKLENYVRTITLEYDSVEVVTGPILSDDLKKIKDVSVPEQFFKILYLYKEDKKKIVAYLLENKKSSQELDDFIVPLSLVSKLSGFIFPN